jgi:transposase
MDPKNWRGSRVGIRLRCTLEIIMAKPRKFTSQFKAQVALAALRGDKSIAALCREHQLSDTVVSRWRKELLERAGELFETASPDEQQQRQIEELERVIGQLTVELTAAKKLSRMLG